MKQLICEKMATVKTAIQNLELELRGLKNRLALAQGFKRSTVDLEKEIQKTETELSELNKKLSDLTEDLKLFSKTKTNIVSVVYDIAKEYPDTQFGAWYFDVSGNQIVVKDSYKKALKQAIKFAEKQNSDFVSVKKFVRVASF